MDEVLCRDDNIEMALLISAGSEHLECAAWPVYVMEHLPPCADATLTLEGPRLYNYIKSGILHTTTVTLIEW